MNLLQLKYFQTVAQLEHISKAAKQLHIAQPSLSMTIAKLEQELGVSLFDRKGRNIVLNPYGQMLLRHTNRIFQQFELLQNDFDSTKQQLENGFRLVVNNSACLYGWLPEFIAKYPEAKISQTVMSEEQAIDALLEEKTDLAIFHSSQSHPDIEELPLLEDEYMVLCSVLHPLAKKDTIVFDDIKNEPLLSPPAPNHLMTIANCIFSQKDATPNIIFEGNIKIAYKLASMGKGLLFSSRQMIYNSTRFPESVLKLTSPLLASPISDVDGHTTLSLCWKKKRTLPPMAKIFRDEFIKTYPRYVENKDFCEDTIFVAD